MDLALGKHRPATKAAEPQAKDLAGFFGPGVEVEGSIKVAAGAFHLNARFKGTVRSDDAVFVGPDAEVESEIDARTVHVSGKVKGSVRATELLEIKEHGQILGDISAPVLTIEPGGFFNGECRMVASEPPARLSVDAEHALPK